MGRLINRHWPLLILLGWSIQAEALVWYKDKVKVKYTNKFNTCPSRSIDLLTNKLSDLFHKTYSLFELKREIVSEKLSRKFFLSTYTVNYDPLKRVLSFDYECPIPLLKVLLLSSSGTVVSNSVLVESGVLYDPTYTALLQEENKIPHLLPTLSLPEDSMNLALGQQFAVLISRVDYKLQNKISEFILDKESQLTLVLSVRNRALSVFLGDNNWSEKVFKLRKIVSHFQTKKKMPKLINMRNSKKVVVKF